VNRVKVLIVAAAADAVIMLVLALVPLAPHGAQVPLLYLLLALQFSAAGFYEPGSRGRVGMHCSTTLCGCRAEGCSRLYWAVLW